MVTLLSANACLEAEKEAAMKQAQSASNAAEAFMASGGEADKELKNKLHQTETGNVKIITRKHNAYYNLAHLSQKTPNKHPFYLLQNCLKP